MMLNDILTFLESLGIKLPVVFSGFAGGLASMDRKKTVSFYAKFLAILSGGFSANYLTPLVGDMMKLNDNSLYGLAFMVGYGGLKFVEILYQVIIKTLHKNNENQEAV